MSNDEIDEELEAILKESKELYLSGKPSFSDMLNDSFRYIAKKELSLFKDSYDNGNKYSLLRAIYLCSLYDLKLPEWVRNAYIESFSAIDEFKVKKLEDAFGSPLKKGEHLAAARKKKKNAKLVFAEVGIARRDGKAVDNELFEEIGLKLGLGKTLVAEYYYELLDIYGAPPLAFSDEASIDFEDSLLPQKNK